MSASYSIAARIDQARECNILDLATRLGAQLKRVTATEWAGACPVCGGTPPRSDRYSVNISKRIFNCRRCRASGDAIAMVQHVAELDFSAALDFIVGKDFVPPKTNSGISSFDISQAGNDERGIARARAIWTEAVDPRTTIVETYWGGRALEMSDLAGRVLRFHPSCPWRDEPTGPLIFVPALLAPMRSIATNEITAISRRRLTSAGEKVGKPKMLGGCRGAAIKMDADDTVTSGLAIGEGLETCAAARQFGIRPVWALGSSGAIRTLSMLAGIECLTILAEQDVSSAAAVQACAQRWHEAGREVLINRPTLGNDLADAIAIRGAA
jgi:putative DNA primase/helicase